MNEQEVQARPLVAIACGGTGGHLFPGVAVGQELTALGCDVLLIVSEKAIDRRATQGVAGMAVTSVPAVGLGRNPVRFLAGLWKSRRAILKRFRERPPAAVLGMGGFTSAAPILAGRAVGARTFLHESNTIPGRANRWLSRMVDEAFVWFPETNDRLSGTGGLVVGTPVRTCFRSGDAGDAREELKLDRDLPTLTVTGGSQGARAINRAIVEIAPRLRAAVKGLQILHLAGSQDADEVAGAYAKNGIPASVHAFLDNMPAALNAATLVVGRAGASSMAELAAVGAPAVLIPYPHAADDHQFHNARAFVDSDAARMVRQDERLAEALHDQIVGLFQSPDRLAGLSRNIHCRHEPNAARRIAERLLAATTQSEAASRSRGRTAAPGDSVGSAGRSGRPTQERRRCGDSTGGALPPVGKEALVR